MSAPAQQPADRPAADRTPAQAWAEMNRGNRRFVEGEPSHPRQDVERREQLVDAQTPHAALFGCSDSRLAAEIIFDNGLPGSLPKSSSTMVSETCSWCEMRARSSLLR